MRRAEEESVSEFRTARGFPFNQQTGTVRWYRLDDMHSAAKEAVRGLLEWGEKCPAGKRWRLHKQSPPKLAAGAGYAHVMVLCRCRCDVPHEQWFTFDLAPREG